MSWENTECPFGGVKERETMLCHECSAELASHPAMAAFQDDETSVQGRRNAAVILVALSRGRTGAKPKRWAV